MINLYHHAQLFFTVEIASHQLFYLDWPGTATLLILAFHIAWDDSGTPLCPAID
jgi:hypothetical protein